MEEIKVELKKDFLKSVTKAANPIQSISEMVWNGLIQIFMGGEELSTVPEFHIQGDDYDWFGKVWGVGDFNGDGYDDLIASRSLTSDEFEFRLELYLGGEEMDTIPDNFSEEVYLSYNLSPVNYAAGDINNDGYKDLIVSDLGVFSGNETGDLNLDYPLDGYLEFSNINGDDCSDVLCFEYLDPFLKVFYGSEELFLILADTLNMENLQVNSGSTFCNAGDLNNDGEDEILVNNGDGDYIGHSATLYGLPESADSEYKIENVKCKLENYPNPFNPTTTITFLLSEESEVQLEVYNLKGQLVKRLIDGEMNSGKHTIEWDGRNAASGIYFARLISGKQEIISKKMILLK